MGSIYIRKEALKSFVIARGAWAQTGLAIPVHASLGVHFSSRKQGDSLRAALLLTGQAGTCSRYPVSGS